MRNIYLVIKREYIEKVTNKTFWIITLLAPFAYLLLIMAPVLLDSYGSDPKRVLIQDTNGGFHKLKDPESGQIFFHYPNDNQINESNYIDQDYQAIIIISKQSDLQDFRIKIISEKSLGRTNVKDVKKIFQKRLEKLRVESLGLEMESYKDISAKLRLKEIISAKDSDANADFMSLLAIIAVAFMLLLMTLYGNMVLRGVQTEKKNRIVEVLLVSMRPFDLMLGKILGISFVGLTQFLAWSILTIMINILAMPIIALSGSDLNSNSSSVVATQDVDMSAKIMQEMMNIEWGEFAIVFFLFFMGGYFLYASIFAAIGAMLNDDSELQSMMFIVMIPIFTAYIIGLSAAQDPNSSLAFWSSMVPFFSPIIMMSIWPYVPLWHIIVSLLILLFSVIFMTHISAKLYRASILMYGQKATIGKFFKLLIN